MPTSLAISGPRRISEVEALILVNGELHPDQKLLQITHRAELVIAADGGAKHCAALQRSPDILIGDFDSISPDLLQEYTDQGAEKLSFPARKNATDLELAIDYAIEQGAKIIYFVGMLGGRWDMSFANVFLLGHEKYKNVCLSLFGKDCEAHVLRPGKHILTPELGKRTSLLPLADNVENITISGFEYPLDDARLQFGTTLGISNIVTEQKISIQFSSGVLLVIFSSPDQK